MDRHVWRIIAALLVAGVCVLAPVTAGVSKAAPQQLPRLTTTGNDFGTFGDRNYCRGSVNVGITSPRRGVLRLTLTSHGFTGSGPRWSRERSCGVLFIATHTSAIAWAKETVIPATFRSRPGQRVVRDIATGSGLVSFAVNPYARNSPVRAPQGYGFGAYVVVP